MASTTDIAYGGVVENTVPFAPLITPNTLPQEGFPLFINSETNEDLGFDPPDLKKTGRISSPVLGVFGEKGLGKTSFFMKLAYIMCQRKIEGREVRVTINDHRRRFGVPEYQVLCEALGAEEVDLSNYLINPISMGLGLKFKMQLSWLQRALQYIEGRTLTAPEKEALRYALRKVRKSFPETADVLVLAMCLRTLTLEDAAVYRNYKFKKAARRHGDNPVYRQMMALLESDPTSIGVTPGLLDAAQTVASVVEELLNGVFSNVFGSEHDLREVSARKVVAWDFSMLEEEAVPLVMSLLWDIKNFGINTKNHDLYTEVEIHDENPSRWRNLTYARAMSTYMKWIRSTDSLLVLGTHRLADYRTVGNEGSEQWNLAQNMLDDIDMWLLFGMTEGAADEMQARLNLSPTERDLLVEYDNPNMVGHALLKIGTEDPIPVRIDLTDYEAFFTSSDAANQAAAITGTY